MFDYDKWKQAAEKTGIDLQACGSRSFELDKDLPWDFIDTGIEKKFLKSEHKKALRGDVTSDCRTSCCACGLECRDKEQTTEHRTQSTEHRTQKTDYRVRSTERTAQTKYRVRFSKTGTLRCLSHQELMTSILRAMRRAGISVTYSSGFHPHPKMSFGPALPVGIEGLNEYFDIELTVYINSVDFQRRLNAALPEGLKVHNAHAVPVNAKPLNDRICRYEYEIIIDGSADEQVHLFMSRQEWPVAREKKTVDIRPMVEKAEINGDRLNVVLADSGSTKVRLYEVLKEMLQKPVEELHAARITRIGLYGYNMDTQIHL
jgi:radical SAM-linked protein